MIDEKKDTMLYYLDVNFMQSFCNKDFQKHFHIIKSDLKCR